MFLAGMSQAAIIKFQNYNVDLAKMWRSKLPNPELQSNLQKQPNKLLWNGVYITATSSYSPLFKMCMNSTNNRNIKKFLP